MKYCPTSTAFRNPASVQNLLTHLVVITFQFVPYIFAIDLLLVVQDQVVLPQRVALFYHGRSHILLSYLRLLRKY